MPAAFSGCKPVLFLDFDGAGHYLYLIRKPAAPAKGGCDVACGTIRECSWGVCEKTRKVRQPWAFTVSSARAYRSSIQPSPFWATLRLRLYDALSAAYRVYQGDAGQPGHRRKRRLSRFLSVSTTCLLPGGAISYCGTHLYCKTDSFINRTTLPACRPVRKTTFRADTCNTTGGPNVILWHSS